MILRPKKDWKYFIAAVVVIFVVWKLVQTSADEKILKALEELRALAEVHQPLAPLEIAEKSARTTSFMAEEVRFEIKFEEYDRFLVVGRRALKDKALIAYTQLRLLELQFRNIDVELTEDRAVVELEASILGALRSTEGKFLEIHRLAITLHQIEGDWQIVEVAHLENLRGPITGK